MNEHQVREHVRKLRRFYTDVLIYVVVNLGLVLIWAISGGGYFWPIWVIIGWGIGLGIHAFSLGLIPQMTAMIPFMTAKWEDQEVRRLMEAGYKGKEREDKKATKAEEIPVIVKGEGNPKVKKDKKAKARPAVSSKMSSPKASANAPASSKEK